MYISVFLGRAASRSSLARRTSADVHTIIIRTADVASLRPPQRRRWQYDGETMLVGEN